MTETLTSLSNDCPIETLSQVFCNIELAQDSLFHLRDRMLEDGSPAFSDASTTIGLYLQYTEQLLSKGRQLAEGVGTEVQ